MRILIRRETSHPTGNALHISGLESLNKCKWFIKSHHARYLVTPGHFKADNNVWKSYNHIPNGNEPLLPIRLHCPRLAGGQTNILRFQLIVSAVSLSFNNRYCI